MTLGEAIEILKRAGVPSPEHDARELFRHAEGLTFGVPIPHGFNSERALPLIERRRQREPLGYITGEVGFFRESYEVTPEVLIPRPDTEILVEYAVANIPAGERFADLCTGSGCIAVSTLKNTKNTTALAVDISEGALAVAERNAKRAGVRERLTLSVCDLLSENIHEDGKFFAVLSNPPYVTTEEYKGLEPEIYREPSGAFLGGEDGTVFYKRLLPLSLSLIKSGGFIAFEIGAYQSDAIIGLAESYGLPATILRDYSGHDRVAIIKKQ
ncbi:MAG: peptide chain release factor N(5)-glutamine methyltransferase [Clostridia bacterium]|nr:peptide chain release factor N(5)-glutamine methyltransferase [Clostridia bacterium]